MLCAARRAGPCAPRWSTDSATACRARAGDTEDAGNGGFFQRYSTGNIYWHKQTGAKWVYGAILQKYSDLGGPHSFLGYPRMDESGTPDQLGRYNHFQDGSIYFSSQTGANAIHGAIRDRWEALGWENSYLGYPRFDQREDGSRFQRFEQGTIHPTGTFHPTTTNEFTFDVSDARFVKSGVIHVDGAAANGWAELAISSTGGWTYKGSIRSTGALSYDVAIVTAFSFRDSAGYAKAFLEKGDVEGTLVIGGHRAHTWEQFGMDPYIKDNWDALRTSRVRTDLTVDFGIGDLLAVVASVVGVPIGFLGLAIGGALAGENLKFCGYMDHEVFNPETRESSQQRGAIIVGKNDPCPPGTVAGDHLRPDDPGPEGGTVGGG